MMIESGDCIAINVPAFSLLHFEIILDYVVNLSWLYYYGFGDAFVSKIMFKSYEQFCNA